MTKSKFYAVKKGLRPGIYHTWAECQEQTHGVSGAAFKSFSTQQAADQYLEAGTVPVKKNRTHSQTRGLRSSRVAASTQEAVCATSNSAQLLQPNKQAGAATQDRLWATDAAVPAWVKPDGMYRLEFDGASRGNPGPAGAGASLFEHTSDSQVGSICLKLGKMTNNQAEYYGLLAGLEACKAIGIKRINVFGDSQLVVKQVQGIYKVSNTALQHLHNRAKLLLDSFHELHIKHVLRAHNKTADALSNKAIDTPGWHGLKDLQGQLWGYCEVVQVAQQGADTQQDEPVSKCARLQGSSAVTTSTVSEQVDGIARCSRKSSWVSCYNATCFISYTKARWQGHSSMHQSRVFFHQQSQLLKHHRSQLSTLQWQQHRPSAHASIDPLGSCVTRSRAQPISSQKIQQLTWTLRRCCKF